MIMSKKTNSLFGCLLLLCCLMQITGTAQQKAIVGFYKALPKGKTYVTDKQTNEVLYYNPDSAIVTNKDIATTRAESTEYTGRPVVRVVLTPAGRAAFGKATRESIGKKILVLMNGRLLMAPMVLNEIAGGEVEIDGNFSMAEARALAVNLAPERARDIEETAVYPPRYFASLDSALVHKDISKLERLLHRSASIGHSNGWVQNKNELIDDLETGKVSYQSIDQISIEEKDIEQDFIRVRRKLKVEGQYEQYPFEVTLSVMEIWKKQSGGQLQLWSRQAVAIKD